MDPAIVFFGACVGLLVGMTGVGGGSLMTPLLIIVFGVKPVTAVGTDLSYAAVTKTVGGVKHLRQRTVDMRLSTWMALGSVPAAIGGVYALKALQRSYGADFNDFIFVVLAAALLLTGVAVLGRALLPTSALERQSARLRRRDKLAAVSIGLSVGFVLGLTSAGSGALIAVALILVFRLVPTRVVGTDVFHAAILLWASAIAHIVAGDVDLGLAGTILIASVPGVWVGSHLSVRLPTALLRTSLGLVLVGSGLGLLSKAGVGVPTALLAAVPSAVALLAVVPYALRRLNRARSVVVPPEPGPAAAIRDGARPTV